MHFYHLWIPSVDTIWVGLTSRKRRCSLCFMVHPFLIFTSPGLGCYTSGSPGPSSIFIGLFVGLALLFLVSCATTQEIDQSKRHVRSKNHEMKPNLTHTHIYADIFRYSSIFGYPIHCYNSLSFSTISGTLSLFILNGSRSAGIRGGRRNGYYQTQGNIA